MLLSSPAVMSLAVHWTITAFSTGKYMLWSNRTLYKL